MEISEVAVPAISAAGGGVSAIWLMKLFITSWLHKYDKALEEISNLSKDMAVTLHRLGTIEKDINGLGQALRNVLKKVET